jgi:hypothetical protein
MDFHDPWNPTHDEVMAWAFDADAAEPSQEFELALSWARQHERTYLELAGDDGCPKRRYFLSLIYFMIGNAVRQEFKGVARPLVEGLIQLGDAVDHPDIRTWQARARGLLADPDEYSFDAWCAGGLAGVAAGFPRQAE